MVGFTLGQAEYVNSSWSAAHSFWAIAFKPFYTLFLVGYKYDGVKFERGNCGVSIMRSGKWSLTFLNLNVFNDLLNDNKIEQYYIRSLDQ